jgi:glucose-6-phosphate 1-epimerase
MALWPHEFMMELDVVLTDVLLLTLRVDNMSATAFHFTSALHTYFSTEDVGAVTLRDLQGIEYVDFLNERRMSVESRSEISIDQPIDRAYRDSPQALTLHSSRDGVRFSITKEGFSDTVVWNPWEQGAQAIADLAPDDFRRMVCVESGNILTPVRVLPGESHVSAQILRAEEGVTP